jgi:formate dehydrogenase subunit beta
MWASWSGTATAASTWPTISPDRKEKIGIVAKGCDSRNIVTHIIENKIKREQLVIIGVPCKGMIDRRRITAMAGRGDPRTCSKIPTVFACRRRLRKNRQPPKAEVLQQNCSVCIHRNPVIHDEMVADPVEEQTGCGPLRRRSPIEAMPSEEKWDYFEDMLAPCIRCYACRNACPLCYCPTCFVDESMPQWVGKSQDPTDIRTFHFLRAYHCAGRCTDCGSLRTGLPGGHQHAGVHQESWKRTVSSSSAGKPAVAGRAAAPGHIPAAGSG